MKKIITKYIIVLIIYYVVVTYGLKYVLNIYYTISKNPSGDVSFIAGIQTLATMFAFLSHLVVAIFMIVDNKEKKLLEWLIIGLALLDPTIAICLLMIWKAYQELGKSTNITNNNLSES